MPSACVSVLRPSAPGCAAVQAVGRVRAAALREERDVERPQELEPPHDAVAAAMQARAAGAAANRELAHAHGVAPLDHLRIGEPRVRHVRVHRVGAGAGGRRAVAAADRFVVAERRVAEERVVHRPLRRRRETERAEQHVDRRAATFRRCRRRPPGNLRRVAPAGGFSRHVGQRRS